VILGLISYGGFETSLPPKKLGGDPDNQKSYDDITKPLEKAQGVWRNVHRKNHGVKEENVLALLLPLGVHADQLDPTLLADLSSFGTARGEVAHTSTVGIAKWADPKDELDRASALVASLLGLDEVLNDAANRVAST